MMEEQARVVARDGDFLWVETVRRGACGGCGESAGCGASILGQLVSGRANRLALEDTLGLAVGERVVVAIPDDLLVRASLAAYLLPLVGLVAAAGVAQWLGLTDVLVALVGVSGLGLGLLATGAITGGAVARKRYRPLLLRRLPPTALAVELEGTVCTTHPSAPGISVQAPRYPGRATTYQPSR
jgi:sigma-E factor negative regulatory protein RseC